VIGHVFKRCCPCMVGPNVNARRAVPTIVSVEAAPREGAASRIAPSVPRTAPAARSRRPGAVRPTARPSRPPRPVPLPSCVVQSLSRARVPSSTRQLPQRFVVFDSRPRRSGSFRGDHRLRRRGGDQLIGVDRWRSASRSRSASRRSLDGLALPPRLGRRCDAAIGRRSRRRRRPRCSFPVAMPVAFGSARPSSIGQAVIGTVRRLLQDPERLQVRHADAAGCQPPGGRAALMAGGMTAVPRGIFRSIRARLPGSVGRQSRMAGRVGSALQGGRQLLRSPELGNLSCQEAIRQRQPLRSREHQRPHTRRRPMPVCADDRAQQGCSYVDQLAVALHASRRPDSRRSYCGPTTRQAFRCHGAAPRPTRGPARPASPRDDHDPDRRDGLRPVTFRHPGNLAKLATTSTRCRADRLTWAWGRLEPGRARSSRLPVPADRRARG